MKGRSEFKYDMFYSEDINNEYKIVEKKLKWLTSSKIKELIYIIYYL